MYKRIIKYYKINGFRKTVGRVPTVFLRSTLLNKYYLYCHDLNNIVETNENFSYEVAVKRFVDEINDLENKSLVKNGNRELCEFKLSTRFDKGAYVWFLKSGGEVLGFIWSIRKKPVSPYFFPLSNHDVHLFDNEIFLDYRGKGLNSILVSHVLNGLRESGFQSAYIETAIWNTQEQKSLSKMKFEIIGLARKIALWNRVYVIWEQIDLISG